MLVLSRTRGQSVMIGDDIDVTVIDMRGDKVRLGINAPKNVAVHRREVYDAIRSQNIASAQLRAEDVPRAPARPTPIPVPVAQRSPETSAMFAPLRDAASGIESYVLAERVAPVQEPLASPASAFSADGRYLWFCCAFPPGGHPRYGRTLAVLDLHHQAIHHFPETQFGEVSPLVDPQSGACYWSTANQVYRRSPVPSDKAALVAQLPASDLPGGAFPLAIATHLTRSADRRALSVDVSTESAGLVGAAPLDGAGAGTAVAWQRLDRPVSSAQFSPVDPDLLLFVEDGRRLMTLRRGREAQPLVAEVSAGKPARIRAAWWNADGRSACFVDREAGACRVTLDTGKVEPLWPAATGRAHADATGHLWVACLGGGGGASPDAASPRRLAFLNASTGRQVVFATAADNAPAPFGHTPPRFVHDDRYVAFSTTARNAVGADLALVPTSALLAATA